MSKTALKVLGGTGRRPVGAPSATPPMLLPLRRWGVDQVLWLPGQAGNYASIPDVNLLDADTAHFEQGQGKWSNGGGVALIAGTSTLALSGEQAYFGANSLKVVTPGSSISEGAGIDGQTALAGTTYSVGVWVHCPLGEDFVIAVKDLTNSQATASSAFVGTGAWQFVTVENYVTGASAVTDLEIAIRTATSARVTTFYIGAAILRTGSDPTFVPSTRIVGDLDVRWKTIAGQDSAHFGFLGALGGGTSRGWGLGWTNEDRIGVHYSVDGSAILTVYSAAGSVGLVPGEPIELRWTRSPSSGEHNFYVNENPLGAPVVGTTGPQYVAGDQPLTIGSYTTGWAPGKQAMLGFEVRDGIDGPIVASADFTNPDEVTGDNWTTPEGHTAQISRSGNATAELVDRACWAFTGSEFMTIDHEPLTTDAFEDFEWFTSFATRHNAGVNYQTLLAMNYSSGVSPVESLEINVSNGLFGRVAVLLRNDDGNLTLSDEGVITYTNDGERHSVSIGRSGDLAELFVDGTREVLLSVGAGKYTIGNVHRGLIFGMRRMVGAPDIPFRGLSDVVAIFSRALTDSERQQLAAWDGSIEQEPVWLRGDPDLVLYLNADDPETWYHYDRDQVFGLQGAPLEPGRTKVKVL